MRKLWVGFLFILVPFFQNCSPVSFVAGTDKVAAFDEDVVRSLEPTLAVRGLGCIECHAKVDSSVISDYGYKNDYFFAGHLGGDWWKSGSPYGDHGQNLKTVEFSSTAKFYVPKVDFTQDLKDKTGSDTLANYVRAQLSQSSFATSQSTPVTELQSVYIGAPTELQIQSAFGMSGSQRMKFKASKEASAALSGLQDEGTFFRNSGTLVCDGDLAIRGPLYLENLHLKTTAGCRLYVMGSVFIYGAITHESTDERRNLQITSSHAISMGLGRATNNGSYCLPGGEWYQANSVASSFVHRFTGIWTVPAQMTRGTTPQAFGDKVTSEKNLIEAKLGEVLDASCRPETRNVSFERILLNAPQVHSRYTGDVKGTIIAEYALISLNSFKFKFDPVFLSVDVLPMIDRSTYLAITK
jgi:hypothetical protein